MIYAELGGVGLLALVGWARRARQFKSDVTARVFVAMFALFWLLMLVSYVRWTLAVLGTDQARQLFPGLSLLAVFLAAGIAYVAPARRDTVLRIWCGGLFTLALGVLVYLHMLFYPSPANLATLPALDGSSAPADFGHTIRIVDYRIDRTQVAPGDSITAQFYWQAQDEPSQDYWLLLQLTGKDGVVANKDGVPGAGRVTTDWWQTGQTFESRHTLIVPKDTAPGTYTLRIGLHPFGKWEWLPVNNRDMLDLGTITVH